MGKQLFFKFSQNENFESSDVVVNDFNRNLFNFFYYHEKWLTNTIFIFGNHGVGKSFLVKTFLKDKIYTELNLQENNLSIEFENIVKSNDYILIDNFNQIDKEELVFALYNFVSILDKKLIIISNQDVDSLKIKLPDLKSRLNYALSFHISDPDDYSLKLIFFKSLSDKQIFLSKENLEYIFKRISRDPTHIQEIIHKIEIFVMEEKKNLTIANIKKFLNL